MGQLLVATYDSWRRDRAIRLGAGLAYYALFAIIPLVSSAIAIAGLLFSESEIRQFIAEQLQTIFSDELSDAATELASIVDTSSTIGGLAVLGVLSGVFAASLLFVALQDALNVIWDIPVQRGFRHSLRRRLVAFSVVFLAGGLLAASLLVSSLAVLLNDLIPGRLTVAGVVDDLVVTLLTWVLGVTALAVLFRLQVRRHLVWRSVIIASTITGLFLILGTWALGVFFKNWGALSLTGAAGSTLLVLVWLYYSAQILIGGAELLKTLDERQSRSQPRR